MYGKNKRKTNEATTALQERVVHTPTAGEKWTEIWRKCPLPCAISVVGWDPGLDESQDNKESLA